MKPWYQKAVFYHIYPLGLLGAPKTNHEASAACRFDELLQWIPHIRDLGCTALYIGPVFESTGHGYDTRDLHLVDRRLGTNEDFTNFVDQCHQHGIRVAVDAVFNHTGREFPAFRDIQEKKEASPYKDWYRGVNFGWGSPMGDSFGYEAWQGHYELPCLNLQNPAVREYLMDTVKFWIDTFHIDGLRLDCANVLDFAFMKELRSRTASMKEDFWLMGEVIHGEYGRWVNGEMLHSVTNYELHKALYSGHNDHNSYEIAHNVKRLESVGRALYTFTDNHDEDRIASKLREPDHLFPVYQLLFTLPGIPSVYYGSEWGIQGARTRESDEALRPALSLKDMEQKTGPITDHISALARIHRDNPELHDGTYKELLLTNRQYAFGRLGENTMILSAVNNDSQPAALSIPVPFPASQAINLLDGEAPSIPVENGRLSVTLPPSGGAIFKLREA